MIVMPHESEPMLHVPIVASDRRRHPRIAAPVANQPDAASLVIIGGGPAGIAPTTAASKRRLLPHFSQGLVVVERDGAISGGQLGRYVATSDSTTQTFRTAVRSNPDCELAAPGAHRPRDGTWRVRLRRESSGHEFAQSACGVVIATGGDQPIGRLADQVVAGERPVDLAGDRLIPSDDVSRLGGYEDVARVSSKRAPRIAVVGGSTSASTTIAPLLKATPALPLGAGAIPLLRRRPLRPFYPSADAAPADWFTGFGPHDICRVSRFVYRLAGFRLEARELVQRMPRIDERVPEQRLALPRVTGDDDAAAHADFQSGDLVIAALGNRPNALPVFDADGRRPTPAADAGRAMVEMMIVDQLLGEHARATA